MGDVIELRPAGLPATEHAYRSFLVASLAMATLVGFVLAIEVPLGRLLEVGSPDRAPDFIQAHGQAQLLGFAGLFVIGMSLRLMPRFAGSRIAVAQLLPLALVLILSGLVLRALILPWFHGDAHSALLVASEFSIFLGSGGFLFVVFGTLTVEARRFDASSLAFLLGATLLFTAAGVATLAAIDAAGDGMRDLPYLTDSAVVQLELIGFVFSFILGVGLRAIPTMVGVERPGRSAGLLAVALASSAALLAASLLYLEYVSYARTTVLLADLAFLATGIVLVVLVWQAGVLRQVANRLRPASQTHLWLIRSAFIWMLSAGLATVYFAGKALLKEELPTQFEYDAVRHALGAGVVTMLIGGMSQMILPEFAADRLGSNWQKQLTAILFLLLNAATLLRVLPSLAGTRWTTDQRNLSMAVAGSLAEVAMLLYAAYFLRLLWREHTNHGGVDGR